MKKYILIFIGLVLVCAFGFAAKVSAQTASGFAYSGVIRSGMSGTAVSSLQSALNTANTGVSTISVDGKFGPATRGAVQYFQSTHGLSADGVVGPITGAALNGAVGSPGVFPSPGPICPNGLTLESNCTLPPIPNPCPLTYVNGVATRICITPPPIPITNPQSPVISGVSGPQSLSVNQQGTWTVSASSQNGGNLSYSVSWGDEAFALNSFATPSVRPPQQSATFTHSYSRAGIYTPTFTVTSENTIRCITFPCPSNAGSAQTSISVNVGNVITAQQLPSITAISPSSGRIGTQVTIFGSGFAKNNCSGTFCTMLYVTPNTINFGSGIIENVMSTDGTSLSFLVPASLTPSCRFNIPQCAILQTITSPGSYDVSVTNLSGTSNSIKFVVTDNNSLTM